jgi:hypothetical protein
VDGISPSGTIRREGDGPPSLEVRWSIRDPHQVNVGDRLGASIRDDAGAEIVAGWGLSRLLAQVNFHVTPAMTAAPEWLICASAEMPLDERMA